jgi:opacity protein-like surface antigen
MLKNLITIGTLAGILSIGSAAHAQAMPTAVAKGLLQIGGGYTLVQPDYTQNNIQGITGFADFDFRPHFGVEAEYHYVSIVTPHDLGENSVYVGPRFVYPRGRLSIYGKAMVGIGTISIQEAQDNPEGGAGSYFSYAIGGGIDIRVTKHIVVRAIDAEYQHWNYQTGLTPIAYTVGAAYRFR